MKKELNKNTIRKQSKLYEAQSWGRYYENKKICENRVHEIAVRHEYLLNNIVSYIQPNKYIIEIGIGTGLLGNSLIRILKRKNLTAKVVEVDFYLPFLLNAKDYCSKNKNYLYYVNADTFQLPFKSNHNSNNIVFHQGLLEHYSDKQIVSMLKEQLRVASIVIASVPSYYYCFCSGIRGDERLLKVIQWKRLLSPYFKVKTSYYGENKNEKYHIYMEIRNKNNKPKIKNTTITKVVENLICPITNESLNKLKININHKDEKYHLLNESKTIAYEIKHNIPILLKEKAIRINKDED